MNEQPRILFVDDEVQILKSIRRHFLDEPYEILTANSGREGLDILEQSPADVVVSDYRMPEMNGGEFLGHVSKKWPETSRLVLSGHADLASLITAINDGEIFKFIGKPWNDQELKGAVRDGVEKHQSLMSLKRVADESLTIAADLLQQGYGKREETYSKNQELESEVRLLKRYEAAFHLLDIPIMYFNPDGGLQEINESALKFLEAAGLSPSENLLDEKLPDDLRCSVWNLLNGIESDLQRLKVKLNDISCDIIAVPLSDEEDTTDGVVLAIKK